MAAKSKLVRMDNVLIVVEELKAAKAFFAELGMELEGETTVEGPWADRVVGLTLADERDYTPLASPRGPHGAVVTTDGQRAHGVHVPRGV